MLRTLEVRLGKDYSSSANIVVLGLDKQTRNQSEKIGTVHQQPGH